MEWNGAEWNGTNILFHCLENGRNEMSYNFLFQFYPLFKKPTIKYQLVEFSILSICVSFGIVNTYIHSFMTCINIGSTNSIIRCRNLHKSTSYPKVKTIIG